MLEYKTIEEDAKDFKNAEKIEFYHNIVLNDQVINEAIIAEGVDGLNGGPTALYTHNDDETGEEETWSFEFEALGERQLLLKLADQADNREVRIR